MRRFKMWVDGPAQTVEEEVTLEDLDLGDSASEEDVRKSLDTALEVILSNEVDAGWAEITDGGDE